MRFVVVAVVLAQLSLAWADDPQRAQDKAAAESIAKDARRLKDPQRLLDCGQAYIDLYNKDPVATDFEELLFQAAQCYDGARALGPALQVYKLVVTYAAQQSPYVAPALVRLGALYQEIGMLGPAADNLEKLTASHASTKGAIDGLADAIRIRGLLEQPALQIKATALFENHYRAVDLVRAAELSLALGPVHTSVRDRVTHLRAHLARYDNKTGDELGARARAQLGEALWGSACPTVVSDGLCLDEPRVRPPLAPRAITRDRCTATRFQARRDPKLVEEAFGLFAEAEKRFARVAQTSDGQQLRTRMRLVRADRELEAALAADRAGKATAIAKVETAYTALAQDPAIAIPATARLARSWQLLAAQSCPPDPALLQRATAAYDSCLAKGSQSGVIDRWTRHCAHERAVLDPSTFAPTAELFPEVPLVAPVLEERPIKPDSNHRQIYRDALGKLAKLIEQPTVAVPACEAMAKTFTDLAKTDTRAELHVMAGLAYGRCNQIAKAKAAYAVALKLEPDDPFAQSNLAELAYRAGQLDTARNLWEAAIKRNGKLFGARLGIAALDLRTMRATIGPAKAKSADDAMFQAANAVAVAPTSSAPLVTMAIVSLHQEQLSLASYFLARAKAIKPLPELDLIHGLVLAARGDAGAIAVLERAAKPGGDLAALALGIHQLALRRYADAAVTLAAIRAPTYELLVARGISARGLGKLAEAESRYTAAILFDGKRPEAHFNLGVLFKDYTAVRTTDPVAAKAAFQKAAAAFRKAATAEAKSLADDCDKAAAAL